MRRPLSALAFLALMASLFSCSSKPDPNTLVMVIESSPTNLDPRVGVEAQSERIDSLIFDYLVVARPRPERRTRPGRALGGSRPSNLHFSLAPRREVSRRAPAHLARCEMDFRFPAERQDSQHQSVDVSLCRSHRYPGRFHGRLSHEGTGRRPAVESNRWCGRHCARRQRR